ncbi:hypothetical protein [Streptomyces roseirectus]|nr:hypothetical protein [Streptomyces roseirectus]
MYKKKLRLVLVTVFSAVAAFGMLNGLAEAKGSVTADSSWRSGVTVAAVDDSSWVIVASSVPGDSSWAVPS